MKSSWVLLSLLSLALCAGAVYLAFSLLRSEKPAVAAAAAAPALALDPPPAQPPASKPAPNASRPVGKPLDLAPKPGQIRGLVKDRGDDIPITHASVQAVLYTPRGERDYALVASFEKTVSVDEHGFFSLQVPGGGWYRVTATAKGFAPATKKKVRPGTNVVLHMLQGAGLSGRVFVEGTKMPVAGVQVSGKLTEGGSIKPVTTDKHGRFFLVDLPSGSFMLKFHHPDFVYKDDVTVDIQEGARQKLSVELDPGKRILGEVVATGDQYPIPGALITVGEKSVKADDSGHFLMRGVPGSQINVQVTAMGFRRHQRRVNLAGSREEAKIQVELRPGAEIYGEVRDEEGHPVAGARIKIYRVYGRDWMFEDWNYRYMKVKTNKRGEYLLSGLSPTRWGGLAVGAKHEDYPDSVVKNIKIVHDDDRIRADIIMHGGGVVAGTVRDQDGNPVGGARVQLRNNSDWSSASENRNVTGTNAAGEFSFKGVSEGKYYLYADAKGYSTAWKGRIDIAGNAERQGIEMILYRGEPLKGEVLDKDTNPVAGVLVNVRSKGAAGKAVTDAAGHFTIPAIPKGPYSVQAKLEGYASFSKWNMEKEGDDLLHIKLRRQPVVKGHVLDAKSGEPLKRFRVYLTRKRENRPGNRRALASRWVQDKQGRFSIQANEGTYDLEVLAEGYVRYLKKGLRLEVGQALEELTVRLKTGGAIEGYVRDQGGGPLRSVQILVKKTGEPKAYFRQKGYSEYDGYYFVGDLASTDYDVLIRKRGLPLYVREGVRVGGAFPARVDADLEHFTSLEVVGRWDRIKKSSSSSPSVVVSGFFNGYRGAYSGSYAARHMRVTIEALEKQHFELLSKGWGSVEGRGYVLGTKRSFWLRNGQKKIYRDMLPGPYRVTAKAPGYPVRVEYVNLDYSEPAVMALRFKAKKKKPKPAAVTSGTPNAGSGR